MLIISRLLLPVLVTGFVAVLISASNASPVTLVTCNKITARWSSVWIFMPDCPPPSATPSPRPSSPAQAPAPAAPEPPH